MKGQIVKPVANTQASNALVHRYARLASLAAAGTTVVPVLIAITAELSGVDPYKAVQRRMVEEISSRYGRDLSHLANDRASGHDRARVSRGLARKIVPAASKVRYLSAIARCPTRFIPVAGALLFGSYAYWETWDLGMTCLAAAGAHRSKSK